jgi:hypothetical protein
VADLGGAGLAQVQPDPAEPGAGGGVLGEELGPLPAVSGSSRSSGSPRPADADHPAASTATSTVHGFAVAMAWSAAILLIAALPIGILISAKAPARPSWDGSE